MESVSILSMALRQVPNSMQGMNSAMQGQQSPVNLMKYIFSWQFCYSESWKIDFMTSPTVQSLAQNMAKAVFKESMHQILQQSIAYLVLYLSGVVYIYCCFFCRTVWNWQLEVKKYLSCSYSYRQPFALFYQASTSYGIDKVYSKFYRISLMNLQCGFVIKDQIQIPGNRQIYSYDLSSITRVLLPPKRSLQVKAIISGSLLILLQSVVSFQMFYIQLRSLTKKELVSSHIPPFSQSKNRRKMSTWFCKRISFLEFAIIFLILC